MGKFKNTGFLQAKREKKELKRRRKNPKFRISNKYVGQTYIHPKISENPKLLQKRIFDSQTKLFNFLHDKNFYFNKPSQEKLHAPTAFSFESDYQKTLNFIKQVFTTVYSLDFLLKWESLTISFEKTDTINISPLLCLNVIIRDSLTFRKRLAHKIGFEEKFFPSIFLEPSSDSEINSVLFASDCPLKFDRGEYDQVKKKPIYGLGTIKGISRSKSYSDNSKGNISKKIRQFINDSLIRQEFELNEDGENHFDSMIGEILSNSEDHSFIDEWYILGNLFEYTHVTDQGLIGEVNLSFLNFGYSIYEGFEETKRRNINNYKEMEGLYDTLKRNQGLKGYLNQFTKSNLMTLYALQEGNSRLKYENESRGSGTMTFIRAFLELGDFELRNEDLIPKLKILSGDTLIICDKETKPFMSDDRFYLSLNKEKDLTVPPSSKKLINLATNFPGTLLSSKVFLNRDHLKEKKRREDETD